MASHNNFFQKLEPGNKKKHTDVRCETIVKENKELMLQYGKRQSAANVSLNITCENQKSEFRPTNLCYSMFIN